MKPLHKTKSDTAQRNYYLCVCEVCGREKEIRVDHIKNTNCKHKPKRLSKLPKPKPPKPEPITKELSCYHRKILNARPLKIRVSANTQKDLNDIVNRMKAVYMVRGIR